MRKPFLRRKMLVGLGALVVLAALVGGGMLLWLFRFKTYHLATVDAGVLYRDGLRSTREMAAACRQAGIRTVVSLVDEMELRREPFRSEAEFCAERKIELVRIPVNLGGWPSAGDVRAFLDLVAQEERRPVLVHCAQGVHRTGIMAAAYQMSVLKYDKARAKEAILGFGHGEGILNSIRGFIDAYDPEKREVHGKAPPPRG